MRVVVALLACAVLLPLAGCSPWGNGDGPVALTLRITDGGTPVQGSIGTSVKVSGAYQYLEADLDANGTATLHLWPGQAELSLRRPNPDQHIFDFGTVVVSDNETLVLDLSAKTASVPVDLTVTDGETGTLIRDASILPQMLFGDYQCIGTRPSTAAPSESGKPYTPPPPGPACDLQWSEPGHLVGKVPPGVLDLRAENQDHSTCMVGFEQTDRTPCRIYAPTLRTFAAVAGQGITATIALPVLPPPDAGLEGYLISGVTGKPIPSKSIQFLGTGAFSNVGFSAYLDGDGSYRLRIPAGDYTATSFVCGHTSITVPFTATAGQTLRLDLLLPPYGSTPTTTRPTTSSLQSWDGDGASPTSTSATAAYAGSSYTGGGPPTYPECDAAMSPTPTGMPPETDGGGGGATSASPPPKEEAPAQVVNGFAYVDFNGGLGPIDGVRSVSHDSSSSQALAKPPSRWSPALGVGVLAGLAVALAVRRRLS